MNESTIEELQDRLAEQRYIADGYIASLKLTLEIRAQQRRYVLSDETTLSHKEVAKDEVRHCDERTSDYVSQLTEQYEKIDALQRQIAEHPDTL